MKHYLNTTNYPESPRIGINHNYNSSLNMFVKTYALLTKYFGKLMVMLFGVALITGTRPEIIKMASVIENLRKKHQTDFIYIHSGQHYDYELSMKFIEEMNLPKPDFWINLHYSDPADQMAELMKNLRDVFSKEKISLVLVQGDTNTTLAAALAANKLGIPVGHIEAGLRSNDFRMPEEFNRRLTDHVSMLLFAPTQRAYENLVRESVWGEIYITGNTVIDAVMRFYPIAEKKSRILERVPFEEFILFTAHRAENVDNPAVLREFVGFLIESPIPVVYPVHPRTRKRLKENNLWDKLKNSKNILLLPPVGYFDILVLMKNAQLIVTDSGGIVEEATAPQIRKPVLIARLSTERPEAIEYGFAKLAGVTKSSLLKHTKYILENYEEIIKNLPTKSPFGDGKTGERIAEIVVKKMPEISNETKLTKHLLKYVMKNKHIYFQIRQIYGD